MYFSKLLLADIIEFANTQGLNQEMLLQRFGLDKLDPSPKEYVTYEVMADALTFVSKIINDETLGLHLGEQLILKGKQQVDDIMKQSPTVDEAFANAVNYSKLISDALKSSMLKGEKFTKILFDVNPNWAVFDNQAVQHIIDMTLVCTLKSIIWLTDKNYLPYEVHLSNPSIKKRNEYYRIFDCSIKFSQPTPGIIFRNPILDQNVQNSNPGLLDKLIQNADKAIEMLESEPALILQIKEIVLRNLPSKSQLKQVAHELNLSIRTLQRRLTELNTSYKKIEKEILLRMAKKLLVQKESNVHEIGYLLGFSEGSAMVRFFKDGTNLTPKKYKDAHWNKINKSDMY